MDSHPSGARGGARPSAFFVIIAFCFLAALTAAFAQHVFRRGEARSPAATVVLPEESSSDSDIPYQLLDEAQGLRARIHATGGVTFVPMSEDRPAWEERLDVAELGVGDELDFPRAARIDPQGLGVVLAFDSGLHIRLASTDKGFQHSMTIEKPRGQAGVSDVYIGLVTSGTLTPRAGSDEEKVELIDHDGVARLRLTVAGAAGSDGATVPARLDVLPPTGAGAGTVRVTIEAGHALAFPVTVMTLLDAPAISPFLPAACVLPPSGMVGWWQFDEGSGTTASDASGSGNNGVALGNPSWTTGEIGGALHFDGVNDEVDVPDNATLDFGTGNFSIDFWIRTTVSSSGPLVVILDKRAASNTGYHVYINQGKIGFQISGVNYGSTAVVNNGNWNHVAITVNRGTNGLLFYLNGSVVTTLTPSSLTVSSTSPMYIGRHRDGGEYFPGDLDELEIFDRALSASEVVSLTSSGGKCRYAWCKNSLCSGGSAPYASLIALPVSSAITNQTQLLLSVPNALYVSKYNRAADTWWRWDGSTCCQASSVKGGTCTPTSPEPSCGQSCFCVNPGEGFAAVVNSGSSYNVFGTDGSTTIALLAATAGVSLSGNNLISLPHCTTTGTASQLMNSIGFASVASVSKYLCATDAFQAYTGRKASGPDFPLTPGEAVFVKMNTTTNYTTQHSSTCTVAGCATCGVDGASCTDGDACTQADSCQSGVCVGSLVSCPSDQCNSPGSCNSSTGVCSPEVPKPNGTACNDANACTQTDTCQSGVCSGSNPVVCAPLDQCHDPGTCNPSTGVCSNPAKPNGTPCNDGNACTQADTCQSGTCTGSNPIVCTASDQCHVAGTCNTSTGACSNPAKPDGSGCSDGNACTQSDTCQSGSCTGSSPVVCTASDACHDVGTCNPSTGICSNPARPDGTTCNDGNACTQTDSCQSGTCTGSNPVVCTADPCHDAGTCNPSTGVCSNPARPNGTSCDDGNLCTQVDTCQSGTCVGSNPVVCTAFDQCHDVGTCNPSTGVCSNPTKQNGTPCSDADVCTTGEICLLGNCVAIVPLEEPASSPMAAGTLPQAIDVGDLNGDGKPDLVTANGTSNDVSIFLGNGAGNFSQAVGSPVPVGTTPRFVAAKDLNGDGILDLAVANGGSNSVSVLLGNGYGGFLQAAGSPISVGTDPRWIAVGDFDRDGQQDLAVLNRVSRTVSILLGNGQGGFNAGAIPAVATASNPLSLAMADVNRDGKLDLVVANNGSRSLSILLGDGTGRFNQAPGSPKSLGTSVNRVVLGDWDRDGNPDIAVSITNSTNITTLLGDGTGQFTTGSPAAAGGIPAWLSVGDFNFDDIPDLVVANSAADSVTVLTGTGSGGFTSAGGSSTDATPVAIAIGDWDGDGKLDLATANQDGNDVTVLLNVTSTAPNGTACSDNDFCTLSDHCQVGRCIGTPVDCEDGNPCTDNFCLNSSLGGLCVAVNHDGLPCSDGNVCTTGDACLAGTCSGGAPRNCDDGDPCTDDTCDPAALGGCVHTGNRSPCDDGDACTSGDTCTPPPAPGPGGLKESFDDVLAPQLPTGWTQQVITGTTTTAWRTFNGSSETAPNSAGASDDALSADKVLTTPAFFVGCPSPRLTFRNSYDHEATYDGGVLEIKVGAGPFQDILAAGGSFLAGGYNGSISTLYGSAIAGRQAWTGSSGGFITTTVALPPSIVGQTISLRWRIATDESVCGAGQFIDTIVIGGTCPSLCHGTPVVCNDSNPCTDDACISPTIGCTFTPNDANACTDNNPCTIDHCAGGTCVSISTGPTSEIDTSLRADRVGTTAALRWTDTPGPYNAYAGQFVRPWAFNQTCLVSSTSTASASHVPVPSPGGMYFYLITRVGPCGESILGTTSSGATRPNDHPCTAAEAPAGLEETPGVLRNRPSIGEVVP